MKKFCKALALILCTIMLFPTLTVIGDSGGKTVLTLEEAKKIALDNDVQFKLQQSYIQQKSEDYEDVYDTYSKTDRTKYQNVAQRVEGEVGRKIAIESAALAVRQVIFTRNDLKRKSDYDVTTAYYDVMKANYSLDDAKRAVELAKKDLEIAKIRSELGSITKNELSQFENAYTTSQTKYNKAFSDIQNYIATLSKNIGKNLDVFNVEFDMTISIPDIKTLDLNKIKEDYMKQNSDFYALSETLDITEYQRDLTQDKYDYYYKRNPNKESKIIEDLNDTLYNAVRDYDNAKYRLSEAEKSLDVTLNTLYTSVNTSVETIENLQKSIANTKTTFEQNKLKYDLGLISKVAFDKSESALLDLENTLNTTIIALNVQYLNLTQYSYEPEK